MENGNNPLSITVSSHLGFSSWFQDSRPRSSSAAARRTGERTGHFAGIWNELKLLGSYDLLTNSCLLLPPGDEIGVDDLGHGVQHDVHVDQLREVEVNLETDWGKVIQSTTFEL